MGKRRRERRGKRDLTQEARKKQCMGSGGSNVEEDAVRGMEEARKTLVCEEMGCMKMGTEKKGAIACVGRERQGQKKKAP